MKPSLVLLVSDDEELDKVESRQEFVADLQQISFCSVLQREARRDKFGEIVSRILRSELLLLETLDNRVLETGESPADETGVIESVEEMIVDVVSTLGREHVNELSVAGESELPQLLHILIHNNLSQRLQQ